MPVCMPMVPSRSGPSPDASASLRRCQLLPKDGWHRSRPSTVSTVLEGDGQLIGRLMVTLEVSDPPAARTTASPVVGIDPTLDSSGPRRRGWALWTARNPSPTDLHLSPVRVSGVCRPQCCAQQSNAPTLYCPAGGWAVVNQLESPRRRGYGQAPGLSQARGH
jgi:hypothetical protein